MAAIPPNSWFGNPRSHSNSRNMIIIAALPLRHLRFHHHQGDTMDSAIRSIFPYLCYSTQSTHNDSKGERRFQFRSFHVLEGLCNVFMGSTSSDKNRNKNLNNKVESFLDASSSRSSRGRIWTNILLAINVVVYIAQIATNGKLMLWGAKINSLIDKGQIWRLATSTFLHANVAHLMVNCFSLNSMGPVVESFGGPSRLLAVYIVSAISSATCSYCLCKSPAVGASGAIFGLVGSFAVYVLRHRNLVGKGNQDLLQIGRVIALNLVIGVLSKGIDNWGHLGGLLGGAALSWLIGPAWTYQRTLADGRAVFADKSPLSQFFESHKKLR